MQVTLLDTARIEAEWPVLAEKLLPSTRQGAQTSLRDAYERLMNSRAVLFEVSDGAEGLLMVSFTEDQNGRLVAWTYAMAGRIDGGPKRRLQFMRNAISVIEEVASSVGCVAHRICGRDYSRLFPDYRPYLGPVNGLEKVLA